MKMGAEYRPAMNKIDAANAAWMRSMDERSMVMMALLIHNYVLNYVLGPFAGSMTTSQLPTMCDWPRGIVLSCAWCLALLRAQNASA